MVDRDRILFELLRDLRLLLDHFGLEDRAASVNGEFVCCNREGFPCQFFRGTYLDCLYYLQKEPTMKILPADEAVLYEECYRIVAHPSYDNEYLSMLRENRLVDRELRRRQKVRRKRRGRPPKRPG